MEFILIILLIGIYMFYTSKETLCNYIEKLTNVPDIDIRALKKQDYTRYKSLIFGDQPQFTNTILT